MKDWHEMISQPKYKIRKEIAGYLARPLAFLLEVLDELAVGREPKELVRISDEDRTVVRNTEIRRMLKKEAARFIVDPPDLGELQHASGVFGYGLGLILNDLPDAC